MAAVMIGMPRSTVRAESRDAFVGDPVTVPTDGSLVDRFGRVHRDLRISLTDRCSLRCTYCMPEQGNEWLAKQSILTADEIERIARVAARAGIHTFRLTGGEPLLRRDVVDIVRRLAQLEDASGRRVEIAMTTNGIRLPEMLDDLLSAGLQRVNISLDTLDRERFRALTRRDRLRDVLAGIEAAVASGMKTVKLNAVAMRGVNDTELIDLVDYAVGIGAQLRFIEQMPLDAGHTWDRTSMVTRQEILDTLSTRWTLTPVPGRGGAPAERFLLDDTTATVGVIASVTAPFCGDCDRMRLTADGQLRNCLFSTSEFDLLPVLRAAAQAYPLVERSREAAQAYPLVERSREAAETKRTDDAIDRVLRACIAAKLPGHAINDPSFLQPARGMNAIGG